LGGVVGVRLRAARWWQGAGKGREGSPARMEEGGVGVGLGSGGGTDRACQTVEFRRSGGFGLALVAGGGSGGV
jgi:hypothetical protein